MTWQKILDVKIVIRCLSILKQDTRLKIKWTITTTTNKEKGRTHARVLCVFLFIYFFNFYVL